MNLGSSRDASIKTAAHRPVLFAGEAFNPDLQWLMDLCRHDLGAEDVAFADGIDVDNVARLADTHRVSVIAERSWRALAQVCRAPAPPASLCASVERKRLMSISAAAHLSRVARALAAAKVPWVALKGPALSVQLYGDPTVRTARDLDIIVPTERWGVAINAVASLGWTAPDQWEKLQLLTGRYEMELRPSLKMQPLLEMHCSLGPTYTQFNLNPFADDVLTHVQVAGAAVPTFRGPAQATYVAWHGARGLWYRLSWLVDYARLLPRCDADADELIMMARACKSECAVRAGALLAGHLFTLAPVPFPAASRGVAARVDRMLAWAIERLQIGVNAPRVWSPPGSYVWFWREIAQQDSVMRSTVAALDHFLRPTASDAKRLGVDVPLAVHRLARPAFLASRLFRALSA